MAHADSDTSDRYAFALFQKRAARVMSRKSFLHGRRVPKVFLSVGQRRGDLREASSAAIRELDAVEVEPRPDESETIIDRIRTADLFVGVLTTESSPTFRVEYATAIGLAMPTFLFVERTPNFEPSSDLLIFTELKPFTGARNLFDSVVEVVGRYIEAVRRRRAERRARKPSIAWNVQGAGMPARKRAPRPAEPALFDPEFVLVLGKDTASAPSKKLAEIVRVLAELDLTGRLLREIPDEPNLTLGRKFLAVASRAFMVIAEDTEASGHLDETRTCSMTGIVTGFVREAGHGSSWMQAEFPLQYRFMNVFCYASSATAADQVCQEVHPELRDAVVAAVNWARQYYANIVPALRRMYPR